MYVCVYIYIYIRMCICMCICICICICIRIRICICMHVHTYLFSRCGAPHRRATYGVSRASVRLQGHGHGEAHARTVPGVYIISVVCPCYLLVVRCFCFPLFNLGSVSFMHGFYYYFNNDVSKTTQHLNDYSAAHVVTSVVSSELLKCRLSK